MRQAAGPVTARGDLEIAGPDGSVLRFPAVWRETNYGRPFDLTFDSTQIRHGRTAFTGSAERLLPGCHADLDTGQYPGRAGA